MKSIYQIILLGLTFLLLQGCGSSTKSNDNPILDENRSEEVCTQVITHAYNPSTQEEKDFPTPCDVPEGWIVVTPLHVGDEQNTTDINTSTYIYGKKGTHEVKISIYSEDNLSVVYHPSTWDTTPTSVIFFGTGWHDTDHNKYKTLLTFIASHGYSVVYVPDSGSYYSQLQKFDAIVSKFLDKLDTSKIGVLGHSSGGGFVFSVLEHMNAKGYGNYGRFLCSMDGYFAQYMDKHNMNDLDLTNILFIQFGPSGNSTDPRVPLVNYSLLTGNGIDKNYIVLPNDNDHGYPTRKTIDTMQGLLKPLDALMEYTFKEKLATHHTMALEGKGKENPYANSYQKVLSIESYKYSCTYIHEHGYHKGSDGKSLTSINNCGEPEIEPN